MGMKTYAVSIAFTLSFLLLSRLTVVGAQEPYCVTDYSNIDGNMILNPMIECDNNNDSMPDNWTNYYNDSEHILSWIFDSRKNSRVLKSEYLGRGAETTGFAWGQDIGGIKPDTWYEFSLDYATEDIEPIINSTNSGIERSSIWTGVSVLVYNSTQKIHANLIVADNHLWVHGPNLTDWDESVGVYRTYSKGSEDWKTIRKYFKTPSNTVSAKLWTYCRSTGRLYIDNLVFREVPGNYNPSLPATKSGKLKFIKYKGQDYFPIIAYGIPKNNTQHIDLNLVNAAGFNSVLATSYRDFTTNQIKQILLDKNLSLVIDFPLLVYHDGIEKWVNDPGHEVQYIGWGYIKSTIDRWAGFENLLAFSGPDETNEKPERDGTFIPNMKPYGIIEDYIQEKADVPLIINFGSPGGYTNLLSETAKYYFPYNDIVSYTWNTPASYPFGSNDPQMVDVGKRIARSIAASEESEYKPHLSMGLGVYWWADWLGKRYQNQYYWYINQIIPFNLQRFQVWDQLINGAVGVWFWGTYRVEFADRYSNYSWKQITAISKELASLYPVLLEPDYYDEWNISDNRIDAMMKKHNGKIYLLTASTHYEDIKDVIITLDRKYRITSIKAVNDIINGDIDNPINRTIQPTSSSSFKDDFEGEDASGPEGLNAPGYAVHIYEIGYSECGNGIIESGEQCDGTNTSSACESLGYSGGILGCNPDCTFDPSGCNACGNNIIDSGEGCDGSNLNGNSCGSFGFARGTLRCTSSCAFDTSGCTKGGPSNGGIGPSPSRICAEGTVRPCGSSIGRCKTGTQACTNGQWGECTGVILPIAELCNGVDDDCNGKVDDGIACDCIIGQTKACGLQTGACRPGYRMCTQGQWASECIDETGPTAEVCGNGLDDDCDGTADEQDCILAASINCTDGMITEPCICQGSTYASGYCYNNYHFAEKPDIPDFPWQILSFIGGGILSAFLLFVVVKEVRHFRRIHGQIRPEEQRKAKLEIKPEKKVKILSVTDISASPDYFIGKGIKIAGYVRLSNKVSDSEFWYSFYDQSSTIALRSVKELKEGYAKLNVLIKKTQLGYVYAETKD